MSTMMEEDGQVEIKAPMFDSIYFFQNLWVFMAADKTDMKLGGFLMTS